MALSNCLFCSRVATITIYSQKGQEARLCASHWFGYVQSIETVIHKAVVMHFRKIEPDDLPLPVDEILVRNGYSKKTDETPGEYRTTQEGKG